MASPRPRVREIRLQSGPPPAAAMLAWLSARSECRQSAVFVLSGRGAVRVERRECDEREGESTGRRRGAEEAIG